MRIKKYVMVIVFGIFAVLAGCGQSAEEKIYNHLEETVSLEADFAKTQNEMTDLESQENKIYDEIMELGMDEFKQIQKLSADAEKNIDKRTEKLGIEQESVENAKEEFKKNASPDQ
ncbi:YkyA family protein [Virgibacillus halophilus]|uniref:YkyA family protein n=1 Tax=Tigheibacillus halophilus TaxID=361280 RepID=A0ABU5CA77_9BACI|nr:YkyA family protein [Virgibacillus halophilus]